MNVKYPRQQLIRAVAVFSTPAVLVLVIGAIAGLVPWLAALGGVIVVILVPGILLHRHFNRIRTVIRQIEGLATPITDKHPVEPPNYWTLLLPGLSKTITEIGHQRQASRAKLKATMAGNESILAALPDPLLALDADRRIVRANPAAQSLFNRPLAGELLHAVLRNPDLLAAAEAVLKNTNDCVVEFSLPGQVERHISARVARLPAATADGTAVIITLHDLTAIRRAERMRADFVANASHELRTPLASLLGFIETLRGPAKNDTEARNHFLGIMHDQAGRMARLIEDLLSLSRIELYEHTPPTEPLEIQQLLENVASTLEPQARAKNIVVSLDLAETPAVTGDWDELTEVFQNLMDNAIKYGRTGTTVQIGVTRLIDTSEMGRRLGRPGIAVTVKDQGEGIAREHLPRLTERFYRVDTARSRELGGTGLGLAIVKHILNRHRALLEVDSTIGKGSTFTVLMPF